MNKIGTACTKNRCIHLAHSKHRNDFAFTCKDYQLQWIGSKRVCFCLYSLFLSLSLALPLLVRARNVGIEKGMFFMSASSIPVSGAMKGHDCQKYSLPVATVSLLETMAHHPYQHSPSIYYRGIQWW